MKALSDIHRSELESYVFPGTDAAVLVTQEKIPQSELETIFGDLSGQHRFYPSENGWKIKFPYWYVHEIFRGDESQMKSKNIEREEKGWDHEHCSFCNSHIDIGTSCYTTDHEEGGYYIICNECSTKCIQ
jgi:hypothetical protein